jgi:hypothetical protein
MRIRCAERYHAKWLPITVIIAVVAAIVAASLPGEGLSPAATTSQIKKPLIYQVGNVVHINAEGPRPLLRALGALQEKYGWIVNYEDPEYPGDSDSGASSQSLPQRRHPNARNVKERFSMEFSSGPEPDIPPDENSVLRIVVDAYNESNAETQFELRKQQDGGFDVVGTAPREDGEISGRQSILDVPITLEVKRRTADETVALICQTLSHLGKIPVTASGVGSHAQGQKTVAIGGIRISARTLLARTLATMGERLSWRLLYDANEKSYELDLTRSSHE